MSELTTEQQKAVRDGLLALMREWSEEAWCAGWLIGLEHRLHQQGGRWKVLGDLVGWPVGADARDGWESWEEAGRRYETAECHGVIDGSVFRHLSSAAPWEVTDDE